MWYSQNMDLSGSFRSWFPLAIAITGVCGLVYVTIQQNYRQSLNDPQIQMAEDAAAALAKGAVPASVVPRGETVDITRSLKPWIAVYDETGKPLESSGILDGVPPRPPLGIFKYMKGDVGDVIDIRRVPAGEKRKRENRISWMPRSDVRSALIVAWVPEAKQFVVAGRNMREVEDREERMGTTIFFAWTVLLGMTFIANAFARGHKIG